MADPITNSVVGIAGSVLNKFVADKNLKMQLEHELKTQLQTANLAQIEVNKIEAASKSWFRMQVGDRVLAGYTSRYALSFYSCTYDWFAVGIAGIQVDLPEFEFSQLSTILMAMLGMAGLRTYEKKEKVTKR